MVLPVGKKGGARRTTKGGSNRPPSPHSYFIDKKGNNKFPKKLGQYRFMICTDLSDSNMMALMLFATWIKINEKYFDSRNQFPIYGFILKTESTNDQALLRTWDFLKSFVRLLQWDESDHHLFQPGVETANKIWANGEKIEYDTEKVDLSMLNISVPESEQKFPTPLENGINDILAVKPTNMIWLHLCDMDLSKFPLEHLDKYIHIKQTLPLTPPVTSDIVYNMLGSAEEETMPHLINFIVLAFNQTDELSVDSNACMTVVRMLARAGVINPKDGKIDHKLVKNMLVASCKLLATY